MTQQTTQTFTVVQKSGIVYILTSWNAESNLFQSINLSGGPNSIVQFSQIALVAKSVDPWSIDSATKTLLKDCSDDSTPLQFNGTFIGGNHGGNFAVQVSATGHGKTTYDIGSSWQDSASRPFTLISVRDEGTLWFLGDDASSSNMWSFGLTMTGPLSHVSGATNTGDITVSSQALTQITPATKNNSPVVSINSGIPLTGDGIYRVKEVSLSQQYSICDLTSVLEYVKSNGHQGTSPALNDASITNLVDVSTVYSWAENGSCVVKTDYSFNRSIVSCYMGLVQSTAPVVPASCQLLQMIPGSRAYSHTNMFNPAQATNGLAYNFSDGKAFAYANSMITGKIKVSPGETYTLWIPQDDGTNWWAVAQPLFPCWDVENNFLGIANEYSNYKYPTNQITTISGESQRYLTFTIQSTGTVRNVAFQIPQEYIAHSEADFVRWCGKIMLETGSVRTAWSAYTTGAETPWVNTYSNASSLTLNSDYVIDTNKPPSRFIQVVRDFNLTPQFGIEIGYSPTAGDTKSDSRIGKYNSFFYVYNSHKLYPYAFSPGDYWTNMVVPGGTRLSTYAYRNPINFSTNNMAINWYLLSGKVYVNVSSFAGSTNSIALPSRFNGYSIRRIDGDIVETTDSQVGGGAFTVKCTQPGNAVFMLER